VSGVAGMVPHVWEGPALPAPVVLALHGRGGSEHDLVPVAHLVAPGHGVLAPRGSEPQAPSGWAWFAHHGIGVPDDDSFAVRLGDLVLWLEAATAAYGIDRPMAALGFSNGGMMAGALVAARPDLVDRAILMSSGYRLPPRFVTPGGLAGRRIAVLGGDDDPFHTPAMMDAGIRAYAAAGARVEAYRYPGVGHTITRDQAGDAAAWLAATVAEDAGGASTPPAGA
jgi:phospholipase/carboxylesterase